MTDRVGLIRAEIERLRKEVKDNIAELGNFESERIGLFNDVEIYDNILSFIDSMQKEHVSKCKIFPKPIECYSTCDECPYSKTSNPVNEDLKEAANNAVISLIPSFGQKNSDGSYVSSYRDCFKREEFINLFIAGANWQKEQMLAKAIRGKVIVESNYHNLIYGCWDMDNALKNCNDGDKVKLIILKDTIS